MNEKRIAQAASAVKKAATSASQNAVLKLWQNHPSGAGVLPPGRASDVARKAAAVGALRGLAAQVRIDNGRPVSPDELDAVADVLEKLS